MYDLFAMHYPNNPNFFIWQPITHMFMHGDLTHIMFNMFGLWMFGTPLEQMWGKQKFIFFYISAGLGAVLLQTIIYHIDVVSVNQILSEYGLSKGEIDLFYETGRLNTSLIQSCSGLVYQRKIIFHLLPKVKSMSNFFAKLKTFELLQVGIFFH